VKLLAGEQAKVGFREYDLLLGGRKKSACTYACAFCQTIFISFNAIHLNDINLPALSARELIPKTSELKKNTACGHLLNLKGSSI